MSFADPISDMITRIRNAQMRGLTVVNIPNSKFRARILDVLKGEGYISNYKYIADTKSKGHLVVDLKYSNGLPVIKNITRISKPGRRIYTKADSIPKIQSGLGMSIVSTSIGIMSDNDARNKNVGGEIICKVF
jgi:small subunit ribosomal protein S8